MEEKRNSIITMLLDIAREVMENQADEAAAVKGYSALLSEVVRVVEAIGEAPDMDDTRAALDEVFSTVEEIISDELNHQKKLLSAYERLTGFEAART